MKSTFLIAVLSFLAMAPFAEAKHQGRRTHKARVQAQDESTPAGFKEVTQKDLSDDLNVAIGGVIKSTGTIPVTIAVGQKAGRKVTFVDFYNTQTNKTMRYYFSASGDRIKF